MTDSDFYDWLRANQPTKSLTVEQVVEINEVLLIVRPNKLQSVVAAMTGWSIASSSDGLVLSARGMALMKRYEGFISSPYKDVVGVWTIGYGNTYYTDGSKVKPSDPALSEPQATKLAIDIINQDFAPAVNKLFGSEIESGALNQNMFDALVSLAYNIGINGLATSKSITGNIKKGDYKAAADGFMLWNKGTIKGVRQPIPGLTRRRKEEKDLFLS